MHLYCAGAQMLDISFENAQLHMWRVKTHLLDEASCKGRFVSIGVSSLYHFSSSTTNTTLTLWHSALDLKALLHLQSKLIYCLLSVAEVLRGGLKFPSSLCRLFVPRDVVQSAVRPKTGDWRPTLLLWRPTMALSELPGEMVWRSAKWVCWSGNGGRLRLWFSCWNGISHDLLCMGMVNFQMSRIERVAVHCTWVMAMHVVHHFTNHLSF